MHRAQLLNANRADVRLDVKADQLAISFERLWADAGYFAQVIDAAEGTDTVTMIDDALRESVAEAGK